MAVPGATMAISREVNFKLATAIDACPLSDGLSASA
jgi:hypothetical protein